jgi:hypothetical protein
MSADPSSSPSLNPLCPRVHPCECGGIHECEALSPIPPGGFNSSADGATGDDAWLYFPGLKVGQTYLFFFLFNYLVALI